VLSTLPLRTPSQQNTASAIQILLIALVPSCHNVSTPHGANSVISIHDSGTYYVESRTWLLKRCENVVKTSFTRLNVGGF